LEEAFSVDNVAVVATKRRGKRFSAAKVEQPQYKSCVFYVFRAEQL
jgi:hypothetical protein